MKTTKICIHCGQEKEATRDNFYYSNKDAKTLKNTCIECAEKYNDTYNKTRRKKKNDVNHEQPLQSPNIQQQKEEKKITNKISPRKKRSDKIEEEVAVEVSLNGLGDGLKALDNYKALHQEICRLMRKNRIAKYAPDVQKIILEIMQACYRHLNNELNKKEVIVVEGTEE